MGLGRVKVRVRADLVDELRVVRDDDDAALVQIDRLGHRAERVAVEVVGRLVEDDDVRRVPHGRGEHHLDLVRVRVRVRVRARVRVSVRVTFCPPESAPMRECEANSGSRPTSLMWA